MKHLSERKHSRFTRLFSGAMLLALCLMFLPVPSSAERFTISSRQAGVLIPAPALIESANFFGRVDSFALRCNGRLIAHVDLWSNKEMRGVIPAGNCSVTVFGGGSVDIRVETDFGPQTFLMWGKQTALAEPRVSHNYVVLETPATIVSSTYDGTKGMTIWEGVADPLINTDLTNRVFHYISPHDIYGDGPKVISGPDGNITVVGKTLVGLTLNPGTHWLLPGRGTADGIVYGEVVVSIPGSGKGGGEVFSLDFESGDLRGWTRTGTAFDTQPTYGDNPTARRRGQPSNHQGNYWIGTYENYPGSGSGNPGTSWESHVEALSWVGHSKKPGQGRPGCQAAYRWRAL